MGASGPIVHLAWYEQEQAELCGRRRHRSAWGKLMNRNGDRHETEEDSIKKHIRGAAGEMAVAKALNRYWHASVDTFHDGADVGDKIQVRWRSKPHYDLIIRDSDQDDHYFFLVVGSIDEGFTVCGWIKGADGKRPEWVKRHGGYSAAYFVPQTALNPVQSSPIRAMASSA
jgi:hypothetical protein